MFNETAFLKAKYAANMEDVPVEVLKDWFDEGEEPIWTVRSLTAAEMAICNEAVESSKIKGDVAEAISDSKIQVEAIRGALGLNSGETPAETVKRLQQLVLGSVVPTITLNVAVILAERHPVEFYILTNKITILTGQGMNLEK